MKVVQKGFGLEFKYEIGDRVRVNATTAEVLEHDRTSTSYQGAEFTINFVYRDGDLSSSVGGDYFQPHMLEPVGLLLQELALKEGDTVMPVSVASPLGELTKGKLYTVETFRDRLKITHDNGFPVRISSEHGSRFIKVERDASMHSGFYRQAPVLGSSDTDKLPVSHTFDTVSVDERMRILDAFMADDGSLTHADTEMSVTVIKAKGVYTVDPFVIERARLVEIEARLDELNKGPF